jgi:hypothetical protein
VQDSECPQGSCQNGVCAGQRLVSCRDAYEPNDSIAQAPLLQPGTLEGLSTCPGDDDYFAIDLGAEERMTATAVTSTGGLTLSLHDPSGTEIARSDAEGPVQEIGGFRPGAAGRYFFHVSTERAETVEYTLEIARTAVPCGAPTLTAPDLSGVGPLPASEIVELGLGVETIYRVSLAEGETLRVAVTSDLGRFALEFYQLADLVLARIAAAPGPGSAQELRYGPVSRPEDLYVRVLGADAESTAFALSAERIPAGGLPRQGTVTGVARFEDRAPLEPGLGEPTPAPIPHAQVELFRVLDDYAVGQAESDSQGRYEIAYANYGDPTLAVRVLARRSDDVAELSVERAPACPEIYAARSPVSLDTSQESSGTIDVLAGFGDAGGAFNIFTVLGASFEFIRGLGYPASPPLTAYWERGSVSPCRTCYGNNQIFIAGFAKDPDEYDDAVIAHEFGHHVEAIYGRSDNPGGPHTGSRIEPAKAWSEGFASFLSSAIRGTPLYADSSDSNTGWAVSLEAERRLGTDGSSMEGNLSEWLVAETLWDLFDDSPGETFDRISRPVADILLPEHIYFRSSALAMRGAPGVDLVDYLDGWFCLGLGGEDDMAKLLQEKQFPYDFAGPADCTPKKPGPPFDLSLEVAAVGPGEGLRISAKAGADEGAGRLRLSLVLPPGWRLLSGGGEVEAPAGSGARLSALVLPGLRGRLRLVASSQGAEGRPATRVQAWPPEPSPAPPRGRRALSARGRPLFVLGGTP